MSYYPSNQYVREIPQTKAILDRIVNDYPYKFPSGYIDYHQFATIAAGYEYLTNNPKLALIDESSATLLIQYHNWHRYNLPLYGISDDTLSVFKGSSVIGSESLFYNFKSFKAVDSRQYGLLLPTNSLVTPDGACVEAIWVQLIVNSTTAEVEFDSSSNLINTKSIVRPLVNRITVSALDTTETIWVKIVDYGPHLDPIDRHKVRNIGSSHQTANDSDFLYNLTNIALNALLTIEHAPEYLDIDNTPLPLDRSTVGFGFGRKTKSVVTALSPLRIRTLSIPTVRSQSRSLSPTTSQGSRAGSPKRPHWRGWHWRNQRYGKGRLLQKPILIDSNYINSNR